MSAKRIASCEGVSIAINGRVILDAIDLSIHAGEVVTLMGRNGAGKTTLLRALSGDLVVERGRVLWNEIDVGRMSLRERARRRAYLSQSTEISFGFRAREIIAMGRYPFDEPKTNTDRAVDASLRALALEDLADRDALTLSGGELRRVELARILAQSDPPEGKLILLDEPVSSLDPAHTFQSLEAIRTLAERGAAVVLVLHELSMADLVSSRVVLLDSGRTVADGSPEEVLSPQRIEQVFGVEAARVDSPLSKRGSLVVGSIGR
jgi:iron complex transport system ATP-binding protein